MDNRLKTLYGILLGATILPLAAQDQIQDAEMREPIKNGNKVRELIFNTDDDQDFMTTKVYKLNHLLGADITPYLRGAVKRYGIGNVERLNYKPANEQFVSVTTARKMIPYIDSIIAVLDRPCDPSQYIVPYAYDATKEKRPTIIDGDGMFKEVYWPKYRHALAMYNAVVKIGAVSGEGTAYYDKDHGFLLIKDSRSDAASTLEFWNFLDRPLPQAELIFTVYEVTEQDAKELGIDWISWKNGPANGLPLFSTGLNGMQNWAGGIEKFTKGPSWMYGGLMFAPQFDASFLRLLANKAKIRGRTAARQVVVHRKNTDLKFDPAFQNISKDEKMNIGVTKGSEQGIALQITDPILCFNQAGKEADAVENLMFNYSIKTQAVAGRSHLGTESVNRYTAQGAITLHTGVEKLLATYSAERDIVQNDGWPILGDIPYLKYLFSTETTVKSVARYYLTVRAVPVNFDHQIDPDMWAIMERAKPRPPAFTDALSDSPRTDLNTVTEAAQ